jgi:dTDP-4-dehydrorhamnose 3,5-epimerase
MDFELIYGNTHVDPSGIVCFINDFDMTKVVQMYAIAPELSVIRAFHGHRLETKWSFVAKVVLLLKQYC